MKVVDSLARGTADEQDVNRAFRTFAKKLIQEATQKCH